MAAPLSAFLHPKAPFLSPSPVSCSLSALPRRVTSRSPFPSLVTLPTPPRRDPVTSQQAFSRRTCERAGKKHFLQFVFEASSDNTGFRPRIPEV
ncbi:hypothetical protein AV530_018463 [Patagioenas fasciata monilis]|uniref:Uncharacterized protein n=1 Tax=Patagioenas fasciata monilis TaxID=372326 RepID=A0A1V4JS04_PATFA|nr:hypothetical protein AV530_018463 [Patagioenas fasciata monilis]